MQPPQAIHPKLFVALAHGAGALGVALAGLLFYALGYLPLKADQQASLEEIEKLRRSLVGSLEVRRQHMLLTKQYKELTDRVRQSRERTPTTSMEDAFLADAARIATEQGLRMDDYQRGKTRHLSGHSELDITLKACGDHAGLCRFLHHMGRLDRVMQIHQLEVDSGDDGCHTITVSFTLYFGLDRSEPGGLLTKR